MLKVRHIFITGYAIKDASIRLIAADIMFSAANNFKTGLVDLKPCVLKKYYAMLIAAQATIITKIPMYFTIVKVLSKY